jgi:hypothetical protein
MTLPVSKVVNVKITSTPSFPQRKGFGVLAIFGTSTSLPAGDRIRFYSDFDGVAADFASTTEEYKAAAIYFSQSPTPSSLAIARRFNTAVGAQLLGSVNASKNIADYTPIVNGGFDIVMDTVLKKVTGLDLSTTTNLNGVASALTTKLAALVAGTSCAWTGTRFIVTSGTTGITSTLGFALPPTGAGSPVDVGALFGLRAVDLGYTSAGAALETIATSLDAVQALNGSWYGFVLAEDTSVTAAVREQQLKDAMTWAEARVKIFGYTTNASNVQDSAQTSDIATFAKNNGYRRTIGIWDDNDAYSIVSALARLFTTDFNGQNTTLTLKFKQLPGTSPVNISESQRIALTSKNINYYSYFGDTAMLAEGVVASGKFVDEVHGLDWQQNAIETNLFGTLATRVTKIPQTDKGMAVLVQAVELGCAQGVINGLLAPGIWNGPDLGQIKSGDFLPRGYYVYVAPIATQNLSDRAARKAPPIQIILKGAGAIHFVDAIVTFEN